MSTSPPRLAQRAPAPVPASPACRRRPSGAPPPLPRHVERSGLIWLAAAIVAVGASIAVFAGGLSRWAVDVTVIDDAITRWVAGAPVPGFTAAASVIAEAGAALATVIAGFVLLLALIVLRRFRRQAVDLANMMLCLALRSTAERVYQRALQFFTTAEISEAFAAARGLALPSQLRHAIRASGRELHEEFLQLLPHRPAPVRVQRWSVRRVGALAVVLVTVLLLVIALANALINTATVASALLVTNMDCHTLEPLLAEAQSVPTASDVMCIRSLPTGWTLNRVEALRGTSVITLGNDRAGDSALQLTLTAHCAASRIAAIRTPEPGIRQLRAAGGGAGYAATYYDVFPGGCVTIALRPATQQAAVDQGLAAQVPVIVGYVSRAALRHELAQRSGAGCS